MATKRQAISKKIRFEVFKRDSFKCQYCGKCAPDVILEVDHINPVSKGGDNEILNLITSCVDCNSGKSDRLLSDDSVMAKQRAQLEELNERREQLEQMLQWRDGLRDIDSMALEAALTAWEQAAPGWTPTESGERDLKKLISKFGLQMVLESIEVSSQQYLKNDAEGHLTRESVDAAWGKLGGVCRMRSQPEWKRDLYYIRGIARNRLSYFDPVKAIRMLEEAYEGGVDIDQLRDIAKTARNWTEFQGDIYGAMGK